MTLSELKQTIWNKVNKNLIDLQVAADKAGVKLPVTSIAEAEKLLKSLTPKKKAPKLTLQQHHIDRYRKAYDDYQRVNFPNWYKDKHAIEADIPDTGKATGLESFIIKYLTWTGHFANRTGNEGRVIVDKESKEMKRIKSSSKKGMQDIDTNLKHPAHPYGIPWKIEVKVGRDTHKKHQQAYGNKVSATGGVYSVVRNVEDFFTQLDRLLIVESKQVSIFENQ